MSKKLARTIITNISDPNYNKNNILHHLSAQLSDGYWENEENFYNELWNWLNFDTQNNKLVIKVKTKPTWPNVKDIFSDKSDVEIIHYIGEVLEDCYNLAPSVFQFDDIIVEHTINELKNYDNIDMQIEEQINKYQQHLQNKLERLSSLMQKLEIYSESKLDDVLEFSQLFNELRDQGIIEKLDKQ